jgi:hypothetical protein
MRNPRHLAEAPNEFGQVLTRVLVARDPNNNDDCRVQVKKDERRRLSKQFVSMLCNGQRDVPLDLIASIAKVLDLPDEWVERLYPAAAVDRGYKIGAIE